MGRRSSKTTLAAIIECWQIARLLALGREALPVPILPGQEIAFLNCATSEEQAAVHYRQLLAQLRKLDIEPVQGSVDRGLTCLLPQQLRCLSLHSNARALRGRTAKVVVFDELAHFQRTAGPLSDEEVWRALAPSVRTFGDAGLVLVTSSPADPAGVLWDLYTARGQVPGLLVAQFATWEFNPAIRRADLEPEFHRHPAWAASEYGAQFAEGSAQTFLPRDLVTGAIAHRPRDPGTLDPEPVYALHLDVGLVHDRTVVAIGHVAGPRAVVDACVAWSGSRAQPVSLQALERWMVDLSRRVRLAAITADPYESALLLEQLRARGLPATSVSFSAPAKARMYARVEEYLRTGRLALPDDPQLIAELSALERLPGPGAPRFHAPARGPVTTDDYADAVAGLLEALTPALMRGDVAAPRWVAGAWERA